MGKAFNLESLFSHYEKTGDCMDRLVIGEVLKPQGIRGELKIKTFTDTPEDVKAFQKVYIDGVEYKILSFRVGDGCAFVGLRGVPDRNAAELLRGKLLEGDRENAPPLEEGQYYIVDILGLRAETEEGEYLGTVVDITSLASEIYTLEKEGKKIIFPAVKKVVKKVDLENKKLLIDKTVFEEIAVY
jgi:16S rRNA processing protein RimM